MNQLTQLGNAGPAVFPIALGCMGMSPGVYGAAPDEKESIATIQTAIERGVTLIDTGDFYAWGHNEMLVRKAIEGRRDKVQLSVKFGAMRNLEPLQQPDRRSRRAPPRSPSTEGVCEFDVLLRGEEGNEVVGLQRDPNS